MDVSCWSFIRMAHLAEPLMKNGGTLFTMTYYGSRMVVENYNIMGVAKAALECTVRYWLPSLARRYPRPRDLAGATCYARRIRNSGIRRAARQGQGKRRRPVAS